MRILAETGTKGGRVDDREGISTEQIASNDFGASCVWRFRPSDCIRYSTICATSGLYSWESFFKLSQLLELMKHHFALQASAC